MKTERVCFHDTKEKIMTPIFQYFRDYISMKKSALFGLKQRAFLNDDDLDLSN